MATQDVVRPLPRDATRAALIAALWQVVVFAVTVTLCLALRAPEVNDPTVSFAVAGVAATGIAVLVFLGLRNSVVAVRWWRHTRPDHQESPGPLWPGFGPVLVFIICTIVLAACGASLDT